MLRNTQNQARVKNTADEDEVILDDVHRVYLTEALADAERLRYPVERWVSGVDCDSQGALKMQKCRSVSQFIQFCHRKDTQREHHGLTSADSRAAKAADGRQR